MTFLFLFLFSCLPKVKVLEPTGSMCFDALQLNLVREGCQSIRTREISTGLEIFCETSESESKWSKLIFYVESTSGQPDPPINFYPICFDPSVTVYIFSS